MSSKPLLWLWLFLSTICYENLILNFMKPQLNKSIIFALGYKKITVDVLVFNGSLGTYGVFLEKFNNIIASSFIVC